MQGSQFQNDQRGLPITVATSDRSTTEFEFDVKVNLEDLFLPQPILGKVFQSNSFLPNAPIPALREGNEVPLLTRPRVDLVTSSLPS